MAKDLTRLARIAYRDGQLLAAHDLSAEKSYEDRLRWLHVAGLHATWGIVSGLAVSGNSGERTLTVAPGYAIDNEGRDLLLSGEARLPLPAIKGPGTLVLTANYRPDGDYRKQLSAQVCLDEMQTPLLEQPEFSWQLPADFCFGREIPLAKIEVADGALRGLPDGRVRRYARREAAPV